MAGISKWEKLHKQHCKSYLAQIDAIYDQAAAEAASLSQLIQNSGIQLTDDIFSFDKFPFTKERVEKLMAELRNNLYATVQNGINAEWDLANAQNDELVRRVFGDKADDPHFHRYFSTCEPARHAFLSRQVSGLKLSDRVWNYTSQFKNEIELGLDCGIREGLPAAKMATQLKQYLKYPDKLFHRVKDEHGVLKLSKAAKAFHPGRGVYRSSYRNARRLTVTETNMAYRSADYERWKTLDFVVGIRIVLSNNHLSDICDDLAGDYPKDFKFVGWHPHCRCHVVTILKTSKEMKADTERILRGEGTDCASENAVTELPDNFKQWLADHQGQIDKAANLPYFITDNFNVSKTGGVVTLAYGHASAATVMDKWQKLDMDITSLKEYTTSSKAYNAIVAEMDAARLAGEYEKAAQLLADAAAKRDELQKAAARVKALREAGKLGKKAKPVNYGSVRDFFTEEEKKKWAYDVDGIFKVKYDKAVDEAARSLGTQTSVFGASKNKVAQFDVSQIVPCQDGINPKNVIHIAESIAQDGLQELPYGYKIGDRIYLMDGHHRVAADIIAGKTKIAIRFEVKDEAEFLKKLESVRAGKPTLKQMAEARHAARTPEQIKAIKDAWNLRIANREFATEAIAYGGKFGVDVSSVSNILAKGRYQEAHDVAVQLRADIDKRIAAIKHVDNAKELAKQHTLKAIEDVDAAVESKLAQFSSLPLDKQKKKLEYEVKWVEDNKKYSTWKIAQDAYKKELVVVEDKIKWLQLDQKIAVLKKYKTTSKPYNKLVADMDAAHAAGDYDKTNQIFEAAKKKADELQTAAAKVKARRAAKKQAAKAGTIFGPEAYTPTRRNAAVWDTGVGKVADKTLVDEAEKAWLSATVKERKAIYGYTVSYCSINEPLQGRKYFGSQSRASFVSKVSSIEKYIDRTALPKDMWFQRGDDGLSVIKSRIEFAGGKMPSNLQDLVGMTMQEGGFMSTGSRKGKGFSGKSVIINVYAPAGTKATYVEPFSGFGAGAGQNWNGKQRFTSFSNEQETLFQRGTIMRITKVEQVGGKTYIDCEVIGQDCRPLSYVPNSHIGY